MVVLEGLEWQGLYCYTLVCIAGWEAWLVKCIAIHWTVLWLEWLQEARLYRNTTWSIVAGDRAAYVARQATVSQHDAGQGSRALGA